ncbi:MAG: hypothetical protein Q8898_09730 [Bacillota bacterium]|nr:hypothetical protein [Bacillota bacterium]
MNCHYCGKECEGFVFEQDDFSVFAHRDCAVKQLETYGKLANGVVKTCSRLQEIKDKFNPDEWFEGFYLGASDIEWLIKQAEKVERLEADLKQANALLEWEEEYGYKKHLEICEIEAENEKLKEDIERWKKINQDLVSAYSNRNERLRDALRDIQQELNRYCSEGWTTKAIEIAKKALEGE